MGPPGTTPPLSVDPITFAVVKSALDSIVDEMAYTVIRTARSEIVKALELSPGDPLMLYNAACCYSRIGEKKQAVKSLRESVLAGLEDYEWIKTEIGRAHV